MIDTSINAETPEFIMDQTGCARCHGEGHQGLVYKKFEHAFEPEGIKDAYTHWSWCPVNGEPILLAFFDLEPVPGKTRPGVTPLSKEDDSKAPPS